MPARKSAARRTELQRLADLVAYLRSPKGCPWDRAQTHLSLIPYLQEESAEVETALRRGVWHEIEDELGDLLLQILLHAEIAREKGRFDLEDLARSQRLKLERRHPHVFGDATYATADAVHRNWDEIKEGERLLRKSDVAARKRLKARVRRAR